MLIYVFLKTFSPMTPSHRPKFKLEFSHIAFSIFVILFNCVHLTEGPKYSVIE